MNRLNINWMGHYYEVLDGEVKVGEICYGISSKKWLLRTENEVNFSLGMLRQLVEFIQRENESNHSYA